MREFLLDLAGVFFFAQFMNEDLDTGFVLVVAPAIAVVDAKTRFCVSNQLIKRDKIANARRDHRRTAHSATDKECRANFA